MKRKPFLSLGLFLLSFFGVISCVRAKNPEIKIINNDSDMNAEKKVLVVFFSHTGENYAVGHIEKGNTHIIAEMIADETGGKLFEIVPEKAYPAAYNECIDVAKKEQAAQARPAVKGDVDVENYDVIFLGYPNWWGDMPMPVYTFLEKHDWAGKTVIPFCTHEGSGLSGTEKRVAGVCKGAAVGKGLAVKGTTAQHSGDQARKSVVSWLERLND